MRRVCLGMELGIRLRCSPWVDLDDLRLVDEPAAAFEGVTFGQAGQQLAADVGEGPECWFEDG